MATMSNLNPSQVELLRIELSQVELGLGFDNMKFANSVVDIAASSQNWIWLGWLVSWGCSLTEMKFRCDSDVT